MYVLCHINPTKTRVDQNVAENKNLLSTPGGRDDPFISMGLNICKESEDQLPLVGSEGSKEEGEGRTSEVQFDKDYATSSSDISLTPTRDSLILDNIILEDVNVKVDCAKTGPVRLKIIQVNDVYQLEHLPKFATCKLEEEVSICSVCSVCSLCSVYSV